MTATYRVAGSERSDGPGADVQGHRCALTLPPNSDPATQQRPCHAPANHEVIYRLPLTPARQAVSAREKPVSAPRYHRAVIVAVVVCALAAGGNSAVRAETSRRPFGSASHSLLRALQVARTVNDHIDRDIRDYTCTFVKRERIQGRLSGYQHMVAAIRHERTDHGQVIAPFSVYLRFLGPSGMRGRGVVYVAGENDGKLIARKGGSRFSYVTMSLDPLSASAMRGNRYPITEIGIKNLVRRLIEVLQEGLVRAAPSRRCRVDFIANTKVNGRRCTNIQFTRPGGALNEPFFQARVYLDDELQIPIRYESYDWPDSPQGAPRLIEEYTYLDVRLNVGLSDDDFQRTKLGLWSR